MMFPISFRLISIFLILLISTTSVVIYKSSQTFEDTLIQRERDSNAEATEAKVKEVDSIIANAVDQVLVSGKWLESELSQPAATPFNFDNYPDILSLEIYQIKNDASQLLGRKSKNNSAPQRNTPFPVAQVSPTKIILIKSVPDPQHPLLSIGVPLRVNEQNQVISVAVADIKLELLQSAFAQSGHRSQFITDTQGHILAHSDESILLSNQQLKDHPLVQKYLSTQVENFQDNNWYLNPDDSAYYTGRYSKSKYDVIVFSEVNKKIILEPSIQSRRNAIRMAGWIFSVAIFFVFVFSMTITKPIETLASIIPHVSRGNFDIHVRSKVKSNDEVGALADAFDRMIEGLKERDKVKSLFSKFHGSGVTEDLLKKEVGLGGSNKDITVFFSDIRGFTAFSESRTPEEVVDMLNQYFSVMVSIVNKNHGTVDKFIGDAIMAVWGVPTGSPQDAENAVKACIEMRIALVELNQKFISAGKPEIKIGMGLHSGRAISGTIGSQERMEYTVIGDTVNMTSRIESSTKAFGTDLLISESVAERVQSHFKVELAGAATVKGKSEPLKLFKVKGLINAQGEFKEVATPYSDFIPEKDDKAKVA